ncbi:MAG TPA: sialidase family protein [Cyclobacteriaceae bacterium]
MRFLNLTLVCCMLGVSAYLALEYSSSPAPKKSIQGASNMILQSKDGGLTWQDISQSLPEAEQPQDFFTRASGLYLRVNNVLYHSNSNLNMPVWEKEENTSLTFNRPGIVESEGVLMATGQQGIRRSTDRGKHWEWVISEGGVGIAIEKINGGFAAIAYNTNTTSRRVHISTDGGETWKIISEGLRPSKSISSITQMGNYLICGHPDGIFRSSDMGKTWTSVHPAVEEVKDTRPIQIEASFGTQPVPEPNKVFMIHASGNTLYAVAKYAGC